mgnify:CR=1 FL=1
MASDLDLAIEVVLNTDPSKLDDLKKAIGNFETELSKAFDSKTIQDFTKDLEKSKQTINDLTKKALELRQKLQAEQKLKIDTGDTVKELEEVNKKLSEEKNLYSLLQTTVKGYGEELQKTFDVANNLQNVANNLRAVSDSAFSVAGKIKDVGIGLVEASATAEDFKSAMLTAFQGNSAGADKAYKDAKAFADMTKFETNEVIEATIKLKAYGTEANKLPDTLNLVANMASGMNKSLDQATEAYADAQTGELERLKEFGITKAQIDEAVNGAVTNAKNKTEETKAVMEGLTKIMSDRFGTSLKDTAQNFNNQMSNLRGEITGLKEKLGNELMPIAKDAVKMATGFVKTLREMSPEMKKTIVALGLLAGGTTLVVGSLAGIGAIGLSVVSSIISITASCGGFTAMMTSLGVVIGNIGAVIIPSLLSSIALIAPALPIIAITGAIVAIEELIRRTIYYNNLREELEEQDKSNAYDAMGEALQKLKEIFPEVKSGQEAFNKVQKEGIENILQQKDGEEKLNAIVKALATEEIARQRIKEDAIKKQNELIVAMNNATGAEKEKYRQQYEAQRKNVQNEQDIIDKLREEKGEIYNAVKGYQDKSDASEGRNPGSRQTDTEVNEEIRRQNLLTETKKQNYEQQIANLQSYYNSYALTEMQGLSVEKEIQDLRDKIAKDSDKAVKDSLSSQKNNWQNFIKDLKISLQDGEISQKQYLDSIKIYEQEQGITIESNCELWLSIEKEYSDGQKKIRNEAEKARKKAFQEEEKEETERQKRKIQTQASELESQGKLRESKIKLLDIQVQDMRDRNLTEIEITEWKNSKIAEIDKEFADKKAKQEQQKLEKILQVEKEILQVKIDSAKREYDMTVELVNRRKDIIIASGGDAKIAEEQANNALHELYKKDLENFKQVEELKKKEMETALQKKITDYKQAGVEQTTISKLVAEEEKNITQTVFQDFLDKEKQKRDEIKKTADEIKALDAEIQASKDREKELEEGMGINAGLTMLPGADLQMASGFKPLGSYTEAMKGIKREQDKQKALEEEKTKKQSEMNRLKAEERDITKATLGFQNEYNTSLDTTIQKLTTIKNLKQSILDSSDSGDGNGNNTHTGNTPSSENNTGNNQPIDNKTLFEKNQEYSKPIAEEFAKLGEIGVMSFGEYEEFQKKFYGTKNTGTGNQGNMPGNNTYPIRGNKGTGNQGNMPGNTYPVGNTPGQTYNVPASSNTFGYNGAGSKTEINYNINVGGKTMNASSQTQMYAEGLTNNSLKYGEWA